MSFSGHGTDTDGTITGYNWRSSIDSQLNTESSFSTSSLSVGTHTIYFKVKDDDGAWSTEDTETLVINPPEDPTLCYDPETYNFGPRVEGYTGSIQFEIWNCGTGTLSYSFRNLCNWISISPTSGSSTGEHDKITLEIDTKDLSLNLHRCYITINSNGGNDIFEVWVTVKEGLTDVSFVNATVGHVGESGFPYFNVVECDAILDLCYTHSYDLSNRHAGAFISDEGSFFPTDIQTVWAEVGHDYIVPYITGDSHNARIAIKGKCGGSLSFAWAGIAYVKAELIVEDSAGESVKNHILHEDIYTRLAFNGSRGTGDIWSLEDDYFEVSLIEGETYYIYLRFNAQTKTLCLFIPFLNHIAANRASSGGYAQYDEITITWLD